MKNINIYIQLPCWCWGATSTDEFPYWNNTPDANIADNERWKLREKLERELEKLPGVKCTHAIGGQLNFTSPDNINHKEVYNLIAKVANLHHY